MELPSYFQTFLSNIEPTVNQKQDASTGHNTLRERLAKDSSYQAAFKDSFLSGSYGRETAIRPIKDVDIIIITNYPETMQPNLALSHLKGVLSNYYRTVTTQNRSVHVALNYVEMDIVPAISASGGFLKIPDRAVQNWVITNPRRHIELSTAMNIANCGLYVPLVKALKWWRDNRMGVTWKPKSFLLECLIYDYATSHKIDSIPKAIEDCIWYFKSKFKANWDAKTAPFIADIGGTGNNVAKQWTSDEFTKFMAEVDASWTLAYRGLTKDDKTESINYWRELFGSHFPQSA